MSSISKLKEVSKIFCSSRPLTEKKRLIGREKQIFSLGKAVIIPCRHVIIYGPRGVGKTSLVKTVVSSHCTSESVTVFEYVCNTKDTPESILYKLLCAFDFNIKDKKEKTSYKRTIVAKAKAFFGEGGAETVRETDEEISPVLRQELTPDYVATAFKDTNVIYCIDEFDRVESDETITFLSELMKALSDYDSGLKLVITGVADSFQDLFRSHTSVSRCLDSVDVPLLHPDDIKEITLLGTKELGLKFHEELVAGISFLSAGLPYFTHLLCEEISFNCLMQELDSAELADLFVALKGVLRKITGQSVDEYQRMELSNNRAEDFFNIDYTFTPVQIKRNVVHAMCLSSKGTPEDILELYRGICSYRKVSGAYFFDDEVEIILILEEILTQSSLIKLSNDIYSFSNPFYKAYSLFQCADELGVNILDMLKG